MGSVNRRLRLDRPRISIAVEGGAELANCALDRSLLDQKQF